MTRNSSSASWNWRITGIDLPVPNSRRIDPQTPRGWSELGFDPASAYDLRRHLGVQMDEPGRFMASYDQFIASDIAFLASGASTDGRHQNPSQQHFPEFDALRNATASGNDGNADRKVFIGLARRLMFDLAAKIDRAVDSTTMVMTVDGMVAPGTPSLPEYMKAQVTMPPSFMDEHPASREHIAHIVQLFIEHVGVPTVGNVSIPAVGHLPLIPNPLPHSTHYIFRGRPAGWRPIPTPAHPHPAVAAPVSSQGTVYDIDELTMDETTLDLLSACERIHQLENDLRDFDSHVARIEELERNLQESDFQVDRLQGLVNSYEVTEAKLRQRLRASERVNVPSPPSTPSRLRIGTTPRV
ncbi:hypothetical protein K438DRAFT_1957351 [Mycena galopus ATCC 62051]|nr:hypothetical protein K438DRAFT_1957351 [Mycena galopus ATCC 62051]